MGALLTSAMGTCCAKGEKAAAKQYKPPPSWGEGGTYPSGHGFHGQSKMVGGYSIPGWSTGAAKTNQDRGLLVLNFGGHPDQTMILVCDGHGPEGHHASQGVVDAFLTEVDKDAVFQDCRAAGKATLTDSLTRAVWEAEETTFMRNKQGRSSGTTFTMAIICGTDLMFTANVGDSRSAMAAVKVGAGKVGKDGKPEDVVEAHDLTEDHAAAKNVAERQRVLKAGGKISSFGGSERVLSPDGNCALCPTRSVGDCEFGRDVVICTPEVVQHKLSPADRYVVVASDGLWEFVEAQAVMLELNHCKDISGACLNLVDYSQATWFSTCGGYCDDITVVAVELPISAWSSDVPGNGSTSGQPTGGGAVERGDCSPNVQTCHRSGDKVDGQSSVPGSAAAKAQPIVIKCLDLPSNFFNRTGANRSRGR